MTEYLSKEIMIDFRKISQVRCSLAGMDAFVEVEWIMLKIYDKTLRNLLTFCFIEFFVSFLLDTFLGKLCGMKTSNFMVFRI